MKKSGIPSELQVVPDGCEAIKYLEGKGKYADRQGFPMPDIVITDLQMPCMDGLALLAWLRKNRNCDVMPVILLSGSSLHEDVHKAYQLNANSYFKKPTTVDELIALVRHAYQYWLAAELSPIPGNC